MFDFILSLQFCKLNKVYILVIINLVTLFKRNVGKFVNHNQKKLAL